MGDVKYYTVGVCFSGDCRTVIAVLIRTVKGNTFFRNVCG